MTDLPRPTPENIMDALSLSADDYRAVIRKLEAVKAMAKKPPHDEHIALAEALSDIRLPKATALDLETLQVIRELRESVEWWSDGREQGQVGKALRTLASAANMIRAQIARETGEQQRFADHREAECAAIAGVHSIALRLGVSLGQLERLNVVVFSEVLDALVRSWAHTRRRHVGLVNHGSVKLARVAASIERIEAAIEQARKVPTPQKTAANNGDRDKS